MRFPLFADAFFAIRGKMAMPFVAGSETVASKAIDRAKGAKAIYTDDKKLIAFAKAHDIICTKIDYLMNFDSP